MGERGEGSFERISWDEALDTIAYKLQGIKGEYGAEAVVFYIAYTKEPRPYFRRLTHAFGSPNYCTETSSCFSAGWLAASLSYGRDYGWIIVNSFLIDPANLSAWFIVWRRQNHSAWSSRNRSARPPLPPKRREPLSRLSSRIVTEEG